MLHDGTSLVWEFSCLWGQFTVFKVIKRVSGISERMMRLNQQVSPFIFHSR